jgi:hypothetical protein
MLEVMIAITILSGAILFIYSGKASSVSLQSYVYPYQKEILSEISNNDTLRGYVLLDNETALEQEFNLTSNLEFKIRVCPLDGNTCDLESALFLSLLEQEVYVDEVIVAANLTEFNPKRVKLFIWQNY